MQARKRARLKRFDYATSGAYFVTICAHRRKQIFGRWVDGDVRPSAVGRTVQQCWAEIPAHFSPVGLDAFVVMPNHVHGVVLLGDGTRALPTVVGSFKSAVRRETGFPVWQRSYYERVIRTEDELEAIRQYILDNPRAWRSDPENPARSGIAASAPWS